MPVLLDKPVSISSFFFVVISTFHVLINEVFKSLLFKSLPVNIVKFLKLPFLIEHPRWLRVAVITLVVSLYVTVLVLLWELCFL